VQASLQASTAWGSTRTRPHSLLVNQAARLPQEVVHLCNQRLGQSLFPEQVIEVHKRSLLHSSPQLGRGSLSLVTPHEQYLTACAVVCGLYGGLYGRCVPNVGLYGIAPLATPTVIEGLEPRAGGHSCRDCSKERDQRLSVSKEAAVLKRLSQNGYVPCYIPRGPFKGPRDPLKGPRGRCTDIHPICEKHTPQVPQQRFPHNCDE